MQDPTEKHCGDVGILVKYKDNNSKKVFYMSIYVVTS